MSDLKTHTQVFGFIMNLGIHLPDGLDGFEEASAVIRRFIKGLKDIVPEIQSLLGTVQVMHDLGYKPFGPTLCIWDHPYITRDDQIKTIETIYRTWFNVQRETDLTFPLFAAISYGALKFSFSPIDASPRFMGNAYDIATRLAWEILDKYSIRKPFILLSDSQASKILFNEPPMAELEKSCQGIITTMEMRELSSWNGQMLVA